MLGVLVRLVWITYCAVCLGAAGPFRCAGRVQPYPCSYNPTSEKSLQNLEVRSLPPSRSMAQYAFGRESTLLRQTFSRIGKRDGIWRGYISGEGRFRIELLILKAGSVFTRHRIGDLEVEKHDGPVRYSYRAPLPRMPSWSWRIVASKL